MTGWWGTPPPASASELTGWRWVGPGWRTVGVRAAVESGTNRGRLFGLVLPVGVGEAELPASVVVGKGVVENAGADLEQ
jgi:hypothetical protein